MRPNLEDLARLRALAETWPRGSCWVNAEDIRALVDEVERLRATFPTVEIVSALDAPTRCRITIGGVVRFVGHAFPCDIGGPS